MVSALAFFASILLHEVGHAVVALRRGIGITDITLWLFGGVARMNRDTDSPGAEFKIAVGRPAVTLLIAGACTAADSPSAARFVEAMRFEREGRRVRWPGRPRVARPINSSSSSST